MIANETGELLYEYTLNVVGVSEYGVSLESLASGQLPPPPEGARFDVAFEGALSGPKLQGTIKGVDYAAVRADGRFDLHIHAEITTRDGGKLALFADGVALPRPGTPIFELRENATLFTAEPAYKWVNPLQVWGVGTVDLENRVIRIRGYSASKGDSDA
jgi:hypothetical protein